MICFLTVLLLTAFLEQLKKHLEESNMDPPIRSTVGTPKDYTQRGGFEKHRRFLDVTPAVYIPKQLNVGSTSPLNDLGGLDELSCQFLSKFIKRGLKDKKALFQLSHDIMALWIRDVEYLIRHRDYISKQMRDDVKERWQMNFRYAISGIHGEALAEGKDRANFIRHFYVDQIVYCKFTVIHPFLVSVLSFTDKVISDRSWSYNCATADFKAH